MNRRLLLPLYSLLLLSLMVLSACSEDEGAPETEQIAAEKSDNGKQAEKKLIGNPANGKALAKQLCADCHGMDGNRGRNLSPFIAGLEQQYLIRSMLAYSNGSREHKKMKQAVEELKPNQVGDISAYYAALATPWQGGALHKPTPPARNRSAVASGKKQAESCDRCHGPISHISMTDVPRLAGMQPEYFLDSLNAYYNGKRHNRIMALLEYSLDKDKMGNIAAYYAAQQPARPPTPKHGDPQLGKVLAKSCAGCHGLDGNSPNPAVPSLSGQHEDYLFKATRDYRNGRRRNRVMREAVALLTDQQIRDLSAHFALQAPDNKLFYNIGNKLAFEPVVDGKRIASACNGCHGPNGNSTAPGTPSLTGLHVNYLREATMSYKNGERRHPAMKTMVSYLDDVAAEKVGFFYALQEPKRRAKPNAVIDEKTAKLSKSCAGCHGKKGISHDPEVPSLAGQDRLYLIRATTAYLKGERQHEGMRGAVEDLDKGDIRLVAQFYAVQQAEKPKEVYPPEKPSKLIQQKCQLCHGERGYSNDYDKPRLAGQSEAYLVGAMLQYADGRRNHSAMEAMADVLSLIEIKGIAAYYAKQ